MVSKEKRLVKHFSNTQFEPKVPFSEGMFLPNHSGINLQKNRVKSGTHKILYTDADGNIIELDHGASTRILTSNGTTSAPSWEAQTIPATPEWSETLAVGRITDGVNPQLGTTDKLEMRDTAIHVSSQTDGHMDIDADISLDFSIGGTEQVILKDGVLEPTTDNDVKLGSDGKSYAEVFMQHAHSRPTRVLDTVYRNTTGHPIIVYGSVECFAADTVADSFAYVKIFTDSSTPPTTEVLRAGIIEMTQLAGLATTTLKSNHCFNFVVQDDDYYQIEVFKDSASNTVTLVPADLSEVDF